MPYYEILDYTELSARKPEMGQRAVIAFSKSKALLELLVR